MKTTLFIAAIALCVSACTMPVMHKTDMVPKLTHEDIKKQDYRTLAWYWDDHAEKVMMDYKGITNLDIREPQGKAQITIGSGPYYGMIELIGQPDGTTRVLSYSWGYHATYIEAWRKLILSAPDAP